jgi:hypothetical protein
LELLVAVMVEEIALGHSQQMQQQTLVLVVVAQIMVTHPLVEQVEVV